MGIVLVSPEISDTPSLFPGNHRETATMELERNLTLGS